MRPSSNPKREQDPVDGEPPEWLLPFGAVGLDGSILGRSIGGPIGEVFAELGCATTAFGAFAFFGLLVEWVDPRKRRGGQ